MANTIANANLGPEYLESTLKSILNPAINFQATLTNGPTTVVNILGPDFTSIYGTFTLDTLNQTVASGLLTNLPAQLCYRVVSGTGQFTIRCTPSV